MAARAVVTINNSVPTAVNFYPTQDNQKGVAYFYDRSGGIAAGFGVLTVSLVEPGVYPAGKVISDANRLYKANMKLILPTLETVSNNSAGYVPSPRPAYACTAKVEFILPERSTSQNRKDLLALTKNLLAHAVATNAVENLEGVY